MSEQLLSPAIMAGPVAEGAAGLFHCALVEQGEQIKSTLLRTLGPERAVIHRVFDEAQLLTTARRVVLDLGIRVQDVDSGLVIRSGAPRVQSDDRFAGGDLDLVQAEMPSWAGASIRVEKDAAGSGSGPFEKLAILSLLGGVVVLYLSGAQ